MNRELFLSYVGVMRECVNNGLYPELLEMYLRNLKSCFNEDQVTDIEDFVFELNDKLTAFSPDEFYEYIQTR